MMNLHFISLQSFIRLFRSILIFFGAILLFGAIYIIAGKTQVFALECHRDGTTWCQNHGGVAQTIDHAAPTWADCLAWCDANSTSAKPLCQKNSDDYNCWLNYPPSGGVQNCNWLTGGSGGPWGAWMSSMDDPGCPTPTPSPTVSPSPVTTPSPTITSEPTVTPSLTPLPSLPPCSSGDVTDPQDKLSAGTQYSCTVLTAGAVQCWGKNDSGQVGNGDNSTNNVLTPAIAISSGAKAVTTGAGFTCALMDDGSVQCWGRNDFGQLGTGSTGYNEYSPASTLLSNIRAISAGSGHACALTNDGAVQCWGKNNYGQVGNGDESGDNVLTPTTVIVSGAVAVGAGTGHTCALLDTGAVQCWGRNDWGQLGNGDDTYANVYSPVTVIESGIQAVSAGRFHTCALTNGGAVECWGKNNFGQVGDSENGSIILTPFTVISSGAAAVNAGTVHSCAVMTNGSVECWGDNSYGEIGTGSSGSSVFTPYTAIGSGVQAVSAGADHTCVMTTSGSVECWGKNNFGQVGNGEEWGDNIYTPYATFPEGYACLGPSTTPTVTPAPSTNNSTTSIPSSYVNIGTPGGLVTLPNGNVWYADTENSRIVQYNPTTKEIVRTVGRAGNAEGEFDGTPNSMTRDSAGNLYVLVGCLVYKLDANGGFLTRYNLNDNSDCGSPFDITYDAHSNSFFVADQGGFVTNYAIDMGFIHKMGSVNDDPPGYFVGPTNVTTDANYFVGPTNVTTDANGRIYVTDEWGGNHLLVFSSDYSLLFEIKNWEDTGGGTTGFVNIKGVVVLTDGTILAVTQDGNHVIEKFDSSGNHLATWGSNSGYLMIAPRFIARDSANNIYVSDVNLNDVLKFSSAGTILSTFSNNLNENGKFFQPRDVTYGPDNHLYVLDAQNLTPRVQEFTNAGSYIGTGPIITLDDSGPYGYENLTFGTDGKLYISTGSSIQVWAKADGIWSEDYRIGCGEGGHCGGLTSPVFDSAGNLYAGSYGDHDVVKFVKSGDQYVYSSEFARYLGDDPFPADQVYEVVGLAIDSSDHMFVSDHHDLKEFDLSGGTPTYVKTIISNNESLGGNFGTLNYLEALSIDPATNNLYLSDVSGHKIVVFSNSGTVLSTIGVLGGGQMQFYLPSGTEINPVTHKLTIADTANGRVESLAGGYRILNLIPSADVIIRTAGGSESTAMNAHVSASLSGQAWDPESVDLSNIPARLMFGAYAVADFTVDLSHGDLDWSTVKVQTLPGDSKALVVNLNQTTAPGISGTHSLYVYRYSNQTSVNVCPDAATLADVAPDCSNGYTLNQGDTGLSAVTVSGKKYWKIDGLTGTGAYSSLFETGFGLQDLMTREQIATTSSHDLTFGTTYDLTHNGDTIIVTFTGDWDLSSLEVGDLGLQNGSTPVTLSGSGSGTNTWGVAIDTGSNTITFTAPTDGTGYITASSTVHVLIADGALANPVAAGTYQIDIRLISDDGGGGQNAEVGSVNIPIVDSDQVDVTGYVNNYLVFDINTRTDSESDCGYQDCLLYEGGPTALNYTVDLGELSSLYVNKSQSTPVKHSSGETAAINSIYLNLTSNAVNGTVVNVSSANVGLQGPNSLIGPVENGQDITANSGKYGFNFPVYSSTHGDVYPNDNCLDSNTYCAFSTEPTWVFNSDGAPVDGASVRMDLAAAAAYTDSPGSYTDTLTFVATGTF